VWIPGGAGLEIGKFGGDRLAGHERARLSQPGHTDGFVAVEKFWRQLAPGAGIEAIDPEDVFDPDQRAEEGGTIPRLWIAADQIDGLLHQPLSPAAVGKKGPYVWIDAVDAVADGVDVAHEGIFAIA